MPLRFAAQRCKVQANRALGCRRGEEPRCSGAGVLLEREARRKERTAASRGGALQETVLAASWWGLTALTAEPRCVRAEAGPWWRGLKPSKLVGTPGTAFMQTAVYAGKVSAEN